MPRKEPPSPRRRLPPALFPCLGAGLLVLLACALFWPILTGTRSVYFGDLALFFIPLLDFQRDELLAGRVPLWNPRILLGTPFLGNPQAWPFYPSSALLYLLPAHHAAGVVGVLHLAVAAVGTLVFLRSRGLGTASAVFGALAFGFGGALVSKMQFPNMVQAGSYLPWLLWGVDRVIRRPDFRRAGLLGLLAGLALLAAHPQMFLMQFYLCSAWTLWRLWPDRGRLRAIAALAAALVLGVSLAAAQLFPAAEQARVSVRAALTLRRANRFYLPPEAALTNFILPNFYGNPATGDYDGRGNFWEPCAYLGLLPFACAVGASVFRSRRVPDVRFWTVAAVVALWLSLGRMGGLYAVAFYVLPGVNKFNDPARWLQVATFAVACLGAHGLDALLAPHRPARRRLLAGGAIALTVADLLPFSRALVPLVASRVWETPPPTALRLRAAPPGRVFHADNPWVWRRFVRRDSYGPTDAAYVRRFLDSLGPNLTSLYGFSDLNGYDPIRGRNIDRLVDEVFVQVDATKGTRGVRAAPLLPATGVGYVLSLRARPLALAGVGPPLPGPGARVQPVGDPAPRAALWTAWQWAPTEEDALERFLVRRSPAAPFVVDDTPLDAADPGVAPARPLIVAGETPDHVPVLLPADAPGGLLVLKDAGLAGWEARVDGRPAHLVAADGIFRAVWVPPGARRVDFHYAPAVFRFGLYFSLVAAGILSSLGAFAAVSALVSRRATRRYEAERRTLSTGDDGR